MFICETCRSLLAAAEVMNHVCGTTPLYTLRQVEDLSKLTEGAPVESWRIKNLTRCSLQFDDAGEFAARTLIRWYHIIPVQAWVWIRQFLLVDTDSLGEEAIWLLGYADKKVDYFKSHDPGEDRAYADMTGWNDGATARRDWKFGKGN